MCAAIYCQQNYRKNTQGTQTGHLRDPTKFIGHLWIVDTIVDVLSPIKAVGMKLIDLELR